LKSERDGVVKQLFDDIHANILIMKTKNNNEYVTNNVVFIDQDIVSNNKGDRFLYFSPCLFEYRMK